MIYYYKEGLTSDYAVANKLNMSSSVNFLQTLSNEWKFETNKSVMEAGRAKKITEEVFLMNEKFILWEEGVDSKLYNSNWKQRE